jgi:hypothetical protein
MRGLFKKRLQARVDLPHFKLDIDSTADPVMVEQLRALMRELTYQNAAVEPKVDFLPFKLEYQTSEEFKNSNLVAFSKRAYTATDSFKYKKATLPLKEIVDFKRDKKTTKIEMKEIERCLTKLFFKIDTAKSDYMAAHIIGNVSKEDMKQIADQITKRAPKSHIQVGNSKKDMLGKLVIELLCFGDFPYEYDDGEFE